MEIVKQKNINDKVLFTQFDDGHIQLDMLPLAKQASTIDLSQSEAEILKKCLTDSITFGMTDNGVKPIYLH